jgi:hypothetical protein
VEPALVVLHGNAKSDEEIAMAVEHGRACTSTWARRSSPSSRSRSRSRRSPRSASSRSTTSPVGSAPATPTSTIPRASAPTSTPYRVLTVKRGARTFVAVDGGMGDNLEVALYGQRFEGRSPTA